MPKLFSPARNALPARQFGFPTQRKVPLQNASHVRHALLRFDPVRDVSDEQRHEAWRRIGAAARRYGAALHGAGWRELFARHGAVQPRRGR